jgi:hypothetical protein
MNIELGIGIGESSLMALSSSDRLIAFAWATAMNPSVSTSSVIHVAISSVPANSNTSALSPSVSNAGNVTVLSVTANAINDAIIPTVLGIRNVSINSVIADMNANGIGPTISFVGNANVNAVISNSAASAGVPTVVVSGTVTTIVSDSFNRADSTTALGTADTGQIWSALSGVWGISSNQAYWITGNPSLHVVESGQSDVQISLDSIVTGSSICGAIGFRATDASNYWFFRNNAGTNNLYKVVGGTATLVSSLAYALSAGTYTFKVVANGSTIECYINGILQFTATDTHNQTATKHGVRNHATTTARFDNFLVQSL